MTPKRRYSQGQMPRSLQDSESLDPAELSEVLDGLLEGWDEFVASTKLTARGTGSRRGRNRTETQMAVVLGLATHVHETARVLRTWMPEQLTVVQMPLVRATYESTLTAVWCDEVDDAANAMLNEEGRFRRRLADTLGKSQSGLPFAEAIALEEWTDLETSSRDEAKWFERLAERVALDNAYGYYRILSNYSHPSTRVTSEYVAAIDDSVQLRRSPKPLASFGWSAVVACCLVWAGTVASYCDPTRSRRSELRVAARRLGIPASLPLLRYVAT